MLKASNPVPFSGARASLLGRLYDALWYAALPFMPVRLWWRARKEPGYREHIAERFGRYRIRAHSPVVWVHAVSLGETHAARPLLAKIRSEFPDATILLTHMTATGRSAGRQTTDARLVQAWLPYDVPSFARGFIEHFRPAAGILIETEVWPNIVDAAHRAGVPMYLVNARLSARSAARYARIASLAQRTFRQFTGIAAQTAADARRIAPLSGTPPVVTGNLKFDVALGDDALVLGHALRTRFGVNRRVWLFASSREGEEALVLDAWRARRRDDALLVLVPRHPQRFDDVSRLLEERGLRYARRSDDRAPESDVQVVLGDSMGEMQAYCAAADVVLMGGGLLPYGGQNLIEPIALGRPTVVGPHMYNFAAATQSAVECGAAVAVHDADEAVRTVMSLLEDAQRRARMEAAALAFCSAHRGAAERLWAWLAPDLAGAIDAARRRSTPAGVNPAGAG